MILPSFLFLFALFSFDQLSASEMVCRDGQMNSDIHCYRVFADHPSMNWTVAWATCESAGMRLLSIDSEEEQTFITDLLFKRLQLITDVWTGAVFLNGSLLRGERMGAISFSHWAPEFPKKVHNTCVEMSSDFGLIGKWRDVPCTKRNVLVCKRTQRWDWMSMMTPLTQMEMKLQEILIKVEKELLSKEKRLSHLEANPVPLGFLYTQYPKEKAPRDIWPSLTWTEVTSAYAGVFFRAEGAGADSFGEIQQENAPRIDKVEAELCTYGSDGKCFLFSVPVAAYAYSPSVSLPKTTGWSDYVGSSHYFYGGTGSYTPKVLHRYHTTAGEVRPRNMAIKVWKRSA